MPAATSTASCPAPLIWKKILPPFLSWTSLSSIFRDRSIVRYAASRSSEERPASPVVGDFAPEARVAAPLARVEAFMA